MRALLIVITANNAHTEALFLLKRRSRPKRLADAFAAGVPRAAQTIA